MNIHNNIFPKLKLINFTFLIKELQYNSSELLKIFYSTFKGKELITNDYSKISESIGLFSSLFKKIEIDKNDIYILENIEKIILNNNILIEVKANILCLYSKMHPYFISKLKCYEIPINFIEFLFKYREEYSDIIYISLQV